MNSDIRGNRNIASFLRTHILPGITRKIALEQCEKLGVEVVEKPVLLEELDKMDGAFLAGTTAQISEIGTIVFFDGQEKSISYAEVALIKKLQHEFYRATRES